MSRSRKISFVLIAFALTLGVASHADAATLQQLSMSDMALKSYNCARAG